MIEPADTSPTIEDFREIIDEADGILLTALGKRFQGIQFLRQFKKMQALPVEDHQREDDLRERWKRRAKKEGVPEPLALLILDCILTESKRIQRDRL